MKNHVKYLAGSLAALLLAATSNLSALSESEISFSGGWRQDHFRSSATTNVDSSLDLIKGSNLDIWQVGVQAWLSPCLSDCVPWLDGFFARGSAHWDGLTMAFICIAMHQRQPQQ